MLALSQDIGHKDVYKRQPFPSAPETYVTSFVLLDEGRAICHVEIRNSSLSHKRQTYLAYGLSEVVTHPQYQNQGLGSKMLKVARDVYKRQALTGAGAKEFVHSILTNDVLQAQNGQAVYGILCYENGCAVDDLIAYIQSDSKILLVVNAANDDKD